MTQKFARQDGTLVTEADLADNAFEALTCYPCDIANETFKVVDSPTFNAEQYASAPQYTSIENAWQNMGEGVILGANRRLVAFHPCHLDLVTHRAQLDPTYLNNIAHSAPALDH